MDPIFSMTAVTAAIQTAGSGALTGAAGEAGRRGWEALAGLARRATRREDDAAGSGADGTADDHRAEDEGRSDGRPDEAGEPDGRPDGEPHPAAPRDAGERARLAAALVAEADRDPRFAGELRRWLREVAGLDRTAAVAPGASRPRLLPPSSPHFTDREHQLAELSAQLQTPQRVAVITGAGGMGKTAAAVHWAHALRPHFPDGQLYAELRGGSTQTAVPPAEVLARFLRSLGVRPAHIPPDQDDRTALFRDLTAELRLLVVLDDAHSAAQVEPLLTAAPGAFTIVTSRRRMPELVRSGARPIPLTPLTAEDSVRLMVRVVGEERFGRQRLHAESVVRRCAGSPLALCSTGAAVRVRDHLDWDLLDRELATGDPQGDDGMPRTEDADPAYRATDLSYRELTPQAARLYRLLALRPWPRIPVGAAAAIAGAGEAETARLLEELAAVHLLEEVAAQRYRFHDVVRRHATRQDTRGDGHPAALRRAVQWFLRLVVEADAQVIPGRWHLGPAYGLLDHTAPRDPAAALALLRRERQNIAEAVRTAEEYGFDDLVWQLCEGMWGFHLRLGFHEQWAATHRRGVAAAQRCADHRAEARMRTQLAFAYLGLLRFDDAERELAEAARVDGEAGHHRGGATALESLGLLRLKQWRWAEAADLFTRAQDALRAISPGGEGAADVPRATALLAHHTGRALRGAGRHTEALARLAEAQQAFARLTERDRYNEARVLMSVAETHLARRDPAAAAAALDEALTVMADEGAALMRADAAELRARCARELGDAAGARRNLVLAHAVYEDLGEAGAVARVASLLEEPDDPA